MKIGRPDHDLIKDLIDIVAPVIEDHRKEIEVKEAITFRLRETKGKETTEIYLDNTFDSIKAEVVKGSCLLCKHCTNMFWDYTNGPYAIICEHEVPEEEIMEKGVWGECEKFEGED